MTFKAAILTTINVTLGWFLVFIGTTETNLTAMFLSGFCLGMLVFILYRCLAYDAKKKDEENK